MESRIDQAYRILTEAEQALSDLIAESLREQRFGEVRAIAALAERVATALHRRPTEPEPQRGVPPSPPTPSTDRAAQLQRKQPRRRDTTAVYPQFRRDGSDLIKLGWSRKKKKEYTHRAPSVVVAGVIEALTRQPVEELFSMEDLLASIAASGTDVPAYQVYVVIGWLKSVTAVSGNGRTRYRCDHAAISPGVFDNLWRSLPPVNP